MSCECKAVSTFTLPADPDFSQLSSLMGFMKLKSLAVTGCDRWHPVVAAGSCRYANQTKPNQIVATGRLLETVVPPSVRGAPVPVDRSISVLVDM